MTFDAITPVLTGARAEAARERAASRRERQRRSGVQRREQLLDVAQVLYAEGGEAAFNMREMARRSGYTAGALYAYFDSRDTILQALQERLLNRLAEAVAAVPPPRAGKAGRLGREVSAGGGGVPEWAIDGFVEQSLAWWLPLARDADRMGLLLRGAGGAHVPLLAVLVPLERSLQVAGLSSASAALLLRTSVAQGLGLLLLARWQGAPVGPAEQALFESGLRQGLHWAQDDTVGQAPAVVPDQGDLFGA